MFRYEAVHPSLQTCRLHCEGRNSKQTRQRCRVHNNITVALSLSDFSGKIRPVSEKTGRAPLRTGRRPYYLPNTIIILLKRFSSLSSQFIQLYETFIVSYDDLRRPIYLDDNRRCSYSERKKNRYQLSLYALVASHHAQYCLLYTHWPFSLFIGRFSVE